MIRKSIQEEDLAIDSTANLLQDELSCSICFRKEINVESLAQHAKEHDDYPCTICKDVNFKSINEQQLHFLNHGVNDGYCKICYSEWTDVKDAADHIKLCKPEFWNVECAQCGKKFPHVEAGEDHVCETIEIDEKW